MRALILGLLLSLSLGATGGDWKHKSDLLPDQRDPKVEEYLKSLPDMDDRYLILDRCYTKGEIAATQQIARLQIPNETREVHRSSMLWVLQQIGFPEEIQNLYLEVFDYVWDTFSMTELPGYVQWVVHNECIKQARKNGELDPLTPEQQKEQEAIEEQYHHLATGGIAPVVVIDDEIKDYCYAAGDDTQTILPLKRAGIEPERVFDGIDKTGFPQEYIDHWKFIINWVYTHDYEFALEYKLFATLECLNAYDKDGLI